MSLVSPHRPPHAPRRSRVRPGSLDLLAPIGGLAILLAAGTSTAQVTFSSVGVLTSGGSRASDTSADGTFVVGRSGSSSRAFRWTSAGGMADLGLPADANSAGANGISGDGSVVTGVVRFASGDRAFRWTEATGMQAIDLSPQASTASGTRVSGDGLVIVGLQFFSTGVRAFRWTTSAGLQDLGAPAGGTTSLASDVSGDGSVIAGEIGTPMGIRASRWTESTGFQDLGTLPPFNRSTALGISEDGSVIVGEVSRFLEVPPFIEVRPFRWSASEGMVELPSLRGGFVTAATDTSGDGSVIVGYGDVGPSTARRALMWTESLGVVDLREYLITEHGLDLSGWVLEQAEAVSADGGTVVGRGSFDGSSRGWVVSGLFEPPCPADLNDDGIVDATDLAILLAAWGGRGPADLDGNGVVDAADLAILLGAWGKC